MSLVSDLEYERNRYYRLLEDIKSIYSNLDNCGDKLDNSDIELSNFYQINDESIDKKRISELVKSIDGTNVILKENIIPAIKNKIEQLNQDIERAQEAMLF